MSGSRERQLALAAELGVQNAAELSPYALSKAMNEAPATASQVNFVTALLRFKNLPMPEGNLTFGQASQILDVISPLVNEGVLNEKGWSEGDILLWRDGFYRIENVHKSKMITLARVELSRESPEDPVRISPTTENRQGRHPFTLQEDDAVKINLEIFQP